MLQAVARAKPQPEMRRLAPPAIAALLALGLAGCTPAPPPPPPQLSVDAAWVRLPAVPGRPGAAYFTLHGGATPARLLAVTSDKVATIELHESMGSGDKMGGMMTMRPIAGVDLPPGATIAFAPQGRHAMLFGIAPDVAAGASLPLAFRFADGTRLTASARTLAAGDPAPQ